MTMAGAGQHEATLYRGIVAAEDRIPTIHLPMPGQEKIVSVIGVALPCGNCALHSWGHHHHRIAGRSPAAGAILTETIFSWPGIGKWMVDSIFRRDYPSVQGGLMLIAAIVMVVNLLVDVTYGFINPASGTQGRTMSEVAAKTRTYDKAARAAGWRCWRSSGTTFPKTAAR